MRSHITAISLFLLTGQFIYPQWMQQNSGTAFALYDVMFLNDQTGFSAGDNGKFTRTTNGGLFWEALTVNPSIFINGMFFVNNLTGFATGYQFLIPPNYYYVYKTTNSGLNWLVSFNADSSRTAGIFFINANTGFFGASYCDTPSVTRIYRTTNQNTWNLIYIANACAINTMKFINNYGYWTGVTNGNIYKTTDYGSHWSVSNVGFTDKLYDLHMLTKDTVITCGEVGKIFVTTNGGINWSPISSGTSYDLVSISFPDLNTGYIQAESNLYLKSTNAGASWTSYNTGNENVMHSIYFANALTGYAVGDGGTILKTTNGGAIGIKPVSNVIPENFEIMQNYPNPFNPATRFNLQVSRYSKIKIEVFSNTGQEIAVLVNEYLEPGTYEVEWDASKFSSGVYFYRLAADDFTQTKKMILLK